MNKKFIVIFVIFSLIFVPVAYGFDLSLATFERDRNFNHESQAIDWDNDGSTIYFIRHDNFDRFRHIADYDVVENYNIVSWTKQNEIDLEEDTFAFKWANNGEYLFASGSNDEIIRYNASTSYDITNLQQNQTNAFSLQTTGLDISPNGNYLLRSPQTNQDIIEIWSFGIPYDLNSITLEQEITAQGSSFVTGVTWNDDGTKFYATVDNEPTIYEYSVDDPYTLNNATVIDTLESNSGEGLEDIVFKPDGQKLYVTTNSGIIEQYNIALPTPTPTPTPSESDPILFPELVNPDEFTTSVAIMILGLITLIGYFAFRLFSPLAILGWAIQIIVFILAILVSLDFIWFWGATILAILLILIGGIARYSL